MKPRFRKRILFELLVLSYLLFSYYALGGWWNSFAGFLLIIFFARLLWGDDFLRRTGLQIDLAGIGFSVVSAAAIIALSYVIIQYMAHKNSIFLLPGNWKDYFHEVFYILNEEIVLGAIILFYLTRTRNLNPAVSAALLAVFFSVVHYVFYRYIFDDRGVIGILALITLFLIGFLRNGLILLSGHIGYSWALHFGWMSVMFGSMHSFSGTGEPLGESQKFNLYLGSFEMLTISALLASVILFFMLREKKSRHSELFPDV